MRPKYVAGFSPQGIPTNPIWWRENLKWEERTAARKDCFMAPKPVEYTCGDGDNARTYLSQPQHAVIEMLQNYLNAWLIKEGYHPMNVCFLNYYEGERNGIGWHADDTVGTNHEAPIVVISYGETREIWWKEIGYKGFIPLTCRERLENGSLFIMPPGMQLSHYHKIPRGDRPMGPRVSLTFRSFNPQ